MTSCCFVDRWHMRMAGTNIVDRHRLLARLARNNAVVVHAHSRAQPTHTGRMSFTRAIPFSSPPGCSLPAPVAAPLASVGRGFGAFKLLPSLTPLAGLTQPLPGWTCAVAPFLCRHHNWIRRCRELSDWIHRCRGLQDRIRRCRGLPDRICRHSYSTIACPGLRPVWPLWQARSP